MARSDREILKIISDKFERGLSYEAEYDLMGRIITLRLRGNGMIELPVEIGQFVGITRLDLSYNHLYNLPEELFQLTDLIDLDLKGNQLRELPIEIGQLIGLTRLDLSDNNLSKLPSEIGKLGKLKSLNLSKNPLKFPYSTVAQAKTIEILQFFNIFLNSPEAIQRIIEFAPEHQQAGIGILNYFGEVVSQKYPDMDVKISIQQDGNKVTMIIEPPEGEIEIIEQTLEDYSLVVTGKKPIEEFLTNEVDAMALRYKINQLSMEVKYMGEMLRLKDHQLASSEQRVETLLKLIGDGLSRPITVTNELNVDNLLAGNTSGKDMLGGDKIIDQDSK
ncbi:MAG: leucine-rich repeat domain-containing protein [Chloroflexota bacterium]